MNMVSYEIYTNVWKVPDSEDSAQSLNKGKGCPESVFCSVDKLNADSPITI